MLSAAALPTSNVAVVPPFTADITATLSAGNNVPVANNMSQVGTKVELPTVPHFPPMTSAVEPPTATVAGVSDMTSWQPSIVAGVDVSQLPPPQRQLFLRLHQQQQTQTPADGTHLSAGPSQMIPSAPGIAQSSFGPCTTRTV